jgi:signal transduction histidine kinase/DNA-binding NarL/FixJ family response regulator
MRTWRAAEYLGGAEVWAAAQSSDGLMHFANLDGVLTHDGRAWGFLNIPPQYPRNLAWVAGAEADPGGGRLYLSGVDALGEIHWDAAGQIHHRDLLAELPATNRTVGLLRDLVPHRDGLFAAGDGVVLRWHAGRLERRDLSAAGSGRLFAVGERLFLHRPTSGLEEWAGGGWQPRPSPAPESGPVVGGWLSPTGSVWLLVRGTGVVELGPNGVGSPIALASSPWLTQVEATWVRSLQDGTVAVGTLGQGLGLFRPDGRQLQVFTTTTGLSSDTIRGVAEDREGGLWIATQDGLNRLDRAVPATHFPRADGRQNTRIGGAVRHEGTLYWLADDALLRVRPGQPAAGQPARLERDPRVPSGVQGSKLLSHPTGLLIGGAAGLYRVDADGLKLVFAAPTPILSLAQSVTDPNRLFLGLADRLLSATVRAGAWVVEGAVPEVGGEVVSLLEEADGTLWSGTTTRGLFRAVRATAAAPWSAAQVTQYVQPQRPHGLPANHEQIFLFDSSLGPHFSTAAGLYRFDRAADQFIADTRLVVPTWTNLIVDPVMRGAPGEAWVNAIHTLKDTPYPLARFRQTTAGAVVFEPASASGRALVGRRGFQFTLWEPTPAPGALWVKPFGGSVFRLELEHYRAGQAPKWAPLIRTVHAAGTNQPVPAFGRFAHGRDPVRITFAPAQYGTGAVAEYQTRLRGLDDRWSEWTTETEREFLNPEGGPFTFEVRLRNEAGEVSPVAAYRFDVAGPWYRRGGALLAYALAALFTFWGLLRWRLARARTEQTRLEKLVARRTRELEQARDVAEEANRAKSRFLANMSHELRTPLNGILGFAQILGRDADLNDRNRERLRIIRSSGDHLLGLINDVLDLARVEAGRVDLRLAPCSLRDLLRDLEASFRPRANQRGLHLEFVTHGLPDGALQGDAQRLRQVLENLLGNALKFTRTGTVTVAVTREPAAASGPLPGPDSPALNSAPAEVFRFTVADTGPGLAPEDLARLFQPFSQAVSGRPPEPGAGLGLAISQHLVGLMGGRIEVASQVGVGSRFSFALPLAPAESAGPLPGAPVQRLIGYDGPRQSVLIVDDLEINRRLLREFLEPLGFPVIEVATGEAALERFTATPTPLVLLDLRMPGMDGFELTRRLRAMPGFTARIVATSASVLGFNRDDALRAGADEFLPKPFKEEQLFELLQHQLRLKWRYAEPEVAPVGWPAAALPASGALPPDALLEPLRTAANRGDIVAVRTELAALKQRYPEHTAFVAELEALAAAYQMTALRRRLGADAA